MTIANTGWWMRYRLNDATPSQTSSGFDAIRRKTGCDTTASVSENAKMCQGHEVGCETTAASLPQGSGTHACGSQSSATPSETGSNSGAARSSQCRRITTSAATI